LLILIPTFCHSHITKIGR